MRGFPDSFASWFGVGSNRQGKTTCAKRLPNYGEGIASQGLQSASEVVTIFEYHHSNPS